jgi:hypothetical protein
MRRGERIATALRLVGRWDGRIVSHRFAERLCDGVARAWPWRRRRNLAGLQAQFSLYHTTPIVGTPIIYTRPSHDPNRLPGPLAHFRLDRDGTLWAYADNLSGWSTARLWWTCFGPVIAALHADFQPSQADHNHD